MTDDKRTLDETLIEILKHADLRVTPQRLAIYGALVATDTHPTAQTLFEGLHPHMPSLSPATVYNTLQVLVERGLIQDIGEAGDGAVHYDADLTPHVNLICTQCHRVEDFFDVSLDGVVDTVITQSGYRVQGLRIAYYGLCPRCQQEHNELEETE
jgi:Fur family peroxide stress response transcriptional regulator